MGTPVTIGKRPLTRREAKERTAALLAERPDLADRLHRLRRLGRTVRSCEVHLTNTCNIRCKGCWYFEGGFDSAVRELSDLGRIRAFARGLRDEGVNQATLIGGEPTLVLRRVEAFVEELPYITVSTNGLRPMPVQGFEHIAIAVSVFGGGPLDDDLRAIRVNGSKFTGLFDTALSHYRNDPRVLFIFALSEAGLPHLEPTVRKIADNGNIVTFNFYSEHGSDHPIRIENERRVLEEALRVKELYPGTVVSHPYFIRALVTGTSHWGARFGYDVCPSLSVDHPDHEERVANGNPVIPGFAAWGADYETLQFCCTSGDCGGCRDSQAVYSWLVVSANRFLDSAERLEEWLDIAESYWRQWHWSPFHAAGATA
ncbi:radical SAM protein [Streptomyces somaliensis]|uniref:radical SAM protein n=1 Tax=Streptomyces somaliensis TaxID=78355 RepID=UPI0020CF6ED5|nr:radical SAM protein [Streptomyces somaliensis]MCP9943750.1 radical SAM protein [Streptomyces somaliensis]MCP9963001.1 radical SAM protein [Streptomyces somaliensis]MCP9975849.1 radical SAM protein [Streptomyces somaliensis]